MGGKIGFDFDLFFVVVVVFCKPVISFSFKNISSGTGSSSPLSSSFFDSLDFFLKNNKKIIFSRPWQMFRRALTRKLQKILDKQNAQIETFVVETLFVLHVK